MKNTKYLSIPDICQRYGIGRSTFHRWVRNDPSFPASVRISNRRYYSELDLMRWESARGGVDPDMPDRMHGLKPCSKVITSYQEFIDAMAARRAEMGLSVMELDARAGMQEGYTSKLENFGRPNGRGIGPEVFPLWLGGLKCAIVLVDLPRRPRKKDNVADRASTEISPDFMREVRRVLAMEPEKQSAVAKVIEASLKEATI